MSLPSHLLACATCLPDQGTEVAHAANMAILFMAVVIIAMLGLLLKIIFNFARRQRQQAGSHTHQP